MWPKREAPKRPVSVPQTEQTPLQSSVTNVPTTFSERAASVRPEPNSNREETHLERIRRLTNEMEQLKSRAEQLSAQLDQALLAPTL